MLAELVHHVVGVDPDRDWVTLAVVDARTSGVIAEGRFPATGDGYRDAVELVDGHSVDTERAWTIEGSPPSRRSTAGSRGQHDCENSDCVEQHVQNDSGMDAARTAAEVRQAKPEGGGGRQQRDEGVAPTRTWFLSPRSRMQGRTAAGL